MKVFAVVLLALLVAVAVAQDFDLDSFRNSCSGFNGLAVPQPCFPNESTAMSEGGYNCCVKMAAKPKPTPRTPVRPSARPAQRPRKPVPTLESMLPEIKDPWAFNLDTFRNTCTGFGGLAVTQVCFPNENAAMTEGGYNCCVRKTAQPQHATPIEVPAATGRTAAKNNCEQTLKGRFTRFQCVEGEVESGGRQFDRQCCVSALPPKAPKGDYKKACDFVNGVVIKGEACGAGQKALYQPTWSWFKSTVCCSANSDAMLPELKDPFAFDLATFTNTCGGFNGVVSQRACSSSHNAALSEGGYNCCVRRATPRPVPNGVPAVAAVSKKCPNGRVTAAVCRSTETEAFEERGFKCCVLLSNFA